MEATNHIIFVCIYIYTLFEWKYMHIYSSIRILNNELWDIRIVDKERTFIVPISSADIHHLSLTAVHATDSPWPRYPRIYTENPSKDLKSKQIHDSITFF